MNTKRNPCTYLIEKLEGNRIVKVWTRGYVIDRDIKKQMYFVHTGGATIDEGLTLWYDMKDVKLTKGRWTNKSNKVISKKSLWRRSK